MKIYDAAVIGAGPAGLFAALNCSNAGLSVCVLEANKKPGKKLLLTGQGRCNITNTLGIPDILKKYGGKERFVRKCLYAFTPEDLMEFFEQNSLKLLKREDGKVFPASESAADVLNCILGLCTKSDTAFIYNCRIDRLVVKNGNFELYSQNDSEPAASASNIVIATGGMSYPSTGSAGDGYRLAELLGHSVITPVPALTAVSISEKNFTPFKSCAGISVSCSFRLFRNGTRQGLFGTRTPGTMLFTHKGVSGPIIIDNSRYFKKGDVLEINLLPHLGPEALNEKMISFCSEHGKSGIKKFFVREGLAERLVSAVINSAPGSGEVPEIRSAELSAKNRIRLAESFTSLRFGISGVDGFNKAMCTAGGVDTGGINPATMESRRLPGLYFAGEVIDVDGDSGGFNLQFAFSSAMAAARAISQKTSQISG